MPSDASVGISCRSRSAIFSDRSLLGRLFDTLGRRTMIALTYALSGLAAGRLRRAVRAGLLTALTQTIGWMIVFFFASPAASAAYLTVSETFPLEIRAMAIAIFYAIGTGLGGVAAPFVSALIESGSRAERVRGLRLRRGADARRRLVAARFAVRAERKLAGGCRHAVVGGRIGDRNRSYSSNATFTGTWSEVRSQPRASRNTSIACTIIAELRADPDMVEPAPFVRRAAQSGER